MKNNFFAQNTGVVDSTYVNELMMKVYNWMAMGLAVSAITALAVLSYEPLFQLVSSLYLFLVIGELIMVIAFMSMINKVKPQTAVTMFFSFAAVNGLTLGIILSLYTGTSIASTFFITAGMFAAMSFYGYTTKKDLTSWGSFLFMGLIGIVIASLVNIFLASSQLSWIISFIGVFLFLGLTAYDTQKIKHMMASAGSDSAITKIAAVAALKLYLDFINLFLFLLRFTGNRR